MTNLIILQEKVQGMLEGERKRRETAIKFLNELQEILEPVVETVWGVGETKDVEGATWIRNKKDRQNKNTGFYFRYNIHYGDNRKEHVGFYEVDNMYGMPAWGNDVTDLKGADFWNAIRCVVNWIPVLIETIDNRNESRDRLMTLVNI